MIRLILTILVFAAPAAAQTARIQSGEHADFTRLVIELPEAGSWTVGKTAMGYAFAVPGENQPGYDIGAVWDRIPRTRLQALRTDPATGVLLVTLACRCHVFPFEYRPGVIVLDIKDGPPPPGSAFELAYEGLPALRTPGPPVLPEADASASGYSWITGRPSDPDTAAFGLADGLALPMIRPRNALGPLRDQLLRQISAGAASGIVDMALPGSGPEAGPAPQAFPWAQVRIGEQPGLAVSPAPTDEEKLPFGGVCIADDMLDLPGWGRDVPTADLVSSARMGLFGEFDRPDPDAIARAVRQHLFLGFGAEARQYAALMASDADQGTREVLVSLSRLVDSETDPGGPFQAMAACDGRAALWAALAVDRLPKGSDVATDAVLRGFLELPSHLRRSLGPGLAEKFLNREDMEAVRIIRDALDRQLVPQTAAVAMIDAKVDLAADRGEDARLHAEAALAEGDQTQAGLVALVDAHLRELRPISPDVATGLGAFLAEAETPEVERDLQRALVLALALSDQTADAFDLAKGAVLPVDDLWEVAAARASDDAFLSEAVGTPPDLRQDLSAGVAASVAARLMTLGFPDAALDWLGPVGQGDSPERRRLAAEAELARGAASEALQHLTGLSTADDEALRARALVQLGRYDPARKAYLAAGLPEEADRLLPWMAGWSDLPSDGSDPWRAVAAELGPTADTDAAGPLTRGRAAADTSAATRSAIADLLNAVEGPSG